MAFPSLGFFPLLAQMRSADRVRKCLLFEVDRTYRGHHETETLDPKRTSATSKDISSFLEEHRVSAWRVNIVFPGVVKTPLWREMPEEVRESLYASEARHFRSLRRPKIRSLAASLASFT
jgi:hypothetical protein